jgi:ElaB/YqjD/DUF883 family membrane-anchored ribosome-binding protein
MGSWDEPGASARTNANGSLNPEAEGQAQIQQAMENARREIEGYVETAADFIRERPVACVAGAVAIGYLIGKLASRR